MKFRPTLFVGLVFLSGSTVSIADDPAKGQTAEKADAEVDAEFELRFEAAEVKDLDVVLDVEVEEEIVLGDVEVFIDRGGMTVNDQAQGHANRRRSLVATVCQSNPDCQLTDEQQSQLAELNQQWIRKAVAEAQKKNDEAQAKQPNVIAMFFGARRAPQQRDQPELLRKRVEKRIDERIDEILTEQQKAAVEAEQKASERFQNEAYADAIIERLSDRLHLTDQQRLRLREKITPWVAKQNLMIAPYFSNGSIFPAVPNHLLGDLTKEQLMTYHELQKTTFTAQNFNAGQLPIVIEP